MSDDRDPSLDTLLSLDGQTFVIDDNGPHWVKFEVRACDLSPDRPQGIRYSLTLHGPNNQRLVGFDNAHPVKGSGKVAADHKHRLRIVRPYEYADAASLIDAFWKEVESVLAEKGVRI